MKRKSLLLVLVILCISAQAQWLQVNGPGDPFAVSDMIAKDSTLLISSSCGSFYSVNDGSAWTQLAPEAFYSSVIFHDTIYTGGEHAHLYSPSAIRKIVAVSGSWQSEEVYNNSGLVSDLFAGRDTLFAAFANDGFNPDEAGFTYSVDGINWSRYNTGLPKDSVNPSQWGFVYVYKLFAVSANHQYIFAGTTKGIYRSPRTSFAWSARNNGLPQEKVTAILSNDTFLLAAIQNKLYKSGDNGENWTLIHTFEDNNTVNRIRLVSDTLFALTETQGVYYSSDQGTSWFPINNGLTSLRTLCIAKHGDSWFLGGGSGIAKGITNWVPCNNNIICSDVLDLEQTDSCIAAIEFHDVFISKDEGVTWSKRTPFNLTGYMNSIVKVNGCLFFSFNPGYPFDNLNYRSCDNGDTWTSLAQLTNYGDPYTLRSNGTDLIAFTDNVMYLSTDAGTTWSDITPPTGLIINFFSDVQFDGNNLYASASYSQAEVIYSHDLGVTWKRCDSLLTESDVYKLGVAGGALYSFSPASLFKSDNHGLTWQECAPLGDGVLDFTSDGELLFACTEQQVFYSNDLGLHWNDISAGLPSLPILWGGTLMVRNHFLYYGTNTYGTWKISTLDLPSSIGNLTGNVDFDVYPNPAKEILTIHPRQDIRIKKVDILDLSGTVIITNNDNRDKIRIGSLLPGLYLLRAETTGNTFWYGKFVKN